MERIDVTDQLFSSFLTDDLWFLERGAEDDIIDRKTGMKYPIQTFRYWRENAYVNGEPNLELLISALHQAEHVFFTQRNNDTVVVLMSNFSTNPDQSFTFSRSNIPRGDFNTRMEQFLRENNVTYQTVLEDFPGEVVSPDRRFVARADGIYLLEIGQKIVEGYSASNSIRGYSGKYFTALGWTYDGRAVIYSDFLDPCLTEITFIGMDGYTCYIEVPQPVVKLNIPEEYLPEKTP